MSDQELIEAVAVKVMGWKRLTHGQSEVDGLWDDDPEFRDALSSSWFDSNGTEIQGCQAEDPDCPLEDPPRWNPLTNAEHSKQVRDRLAELGFTGQCLTRDPYTVERELWRFSVSAYGEDGRLERHFIEAAHNEFRAVVLCALEACK